MNRALISTVINTVISVYSMMIGKLVEFKVGTRGSVHRTFCRGERIDLTLGDEGCGLLGRLAICRAGDCEACIGENSTG